MNKAESFIDSMLDYHEQTKHHPDRYARSPGYMDWDNQPNPFRFYKGARNLDLPLMNKPGEFPYGSLFGAPVVDPVPIRLETISGFLELSLGLSAWKQHGVSEWSLRMNPSSGNLHPSECYLLLPQCGDSAACIAHYNPLMHRLEIRASLQDKEARSLIGLNGFGIVLSSIFWREAWKYGERAFRYTQHDVGHALGALCFSAALNGWKLAARPEIESSCLDRLLGFEPSRQIPGESERADCFCWISGSNPNEPQVSDWLSTLQIPEYQDTANRLSTNQTPWPIIDDAEQLTRSPGFQARRPESVKSDSGQTSDYPAEWVIRNRRSAQAYDSRFSRIAYSRFTQILSATLPSGQLPLDALPLATNVHLVLFVHRVDDLDSGLYCLVRDPSDLKTLRDSFDPGFSWDKVDRVLPLYLLQKGDYRTAAETVSCHQAIAGDSAFSMGMLARFESVVKDAPWLYPCLFWESGLIGQILYLEAEAKGLRGTGIGCYFDDMMHQLLGLKDRHWQDLYHFTIGAPLEDARLQTKPPYHHLQDLATRCR